MPRVRPLLQRAAEVYLRSRVLRGAAVAWLGYLTIGWLLGFPGDDFIPYRIDFDVYRLGGQRFLDGGSLYAGDLQTLVEGLPFTYPPIAAVLFSAFAVMPWRWGSVTLSALTVVSILVVVFLVIRELGASRRDAAWLAVPVGGVALILEPLVETVEYGQINAVLMAAVMVDLLVGRGRWWQGSLVGLAIAVKLTPLVFLGWFLMRSDWRQFVVGAGSALLFTGIGFLLAPSDSVAYWTRVLPDSDRIGEPAYPSNQSLNGVLHRAGLSESTLLWFLACALIGLACLWLIRRMFQRGDDLTPAVVLGLYALVASPVSWSHHFVWVTPALILVVAMAWREDADGVAWALAGLAAAGLWVFLSAPHWNLPHPPKQNPNWTPIQQLVGSAYFAWVFLALPFLGVFHRGRHPG